MKNAILIVSLLFISFVGWTQTVDTLPVITYQYRNITIADRLAPDSVNFTRNGDTLIIAENKWKGYPSYPIAVKSEVSDTLVVNLLDTGKVFLAADGRFLTTIRIPNAFKASDNIKLKFEGKAYNITLLITNLSYTYDNLSDVKIYPNPAKNDLNILSDEGIDRIVIFNSSGQMVDYIGKTASVLDLQTYTPGIYYLSIFTFNGVIKKSFKKE